MRLPGRCPYYLKSQGEKDGVYIRAGATTQQADDATRHELALESEGCSAVIAMSSHLWLF